MTINRVIMAGVFSFPEGEAASSRILNIARGFMDHIEDVQVISAYHHEDNKGFKLQGDIVYCNKIIPFKAISPHIFTGTNINERLKTRLRFYKLIKVLVRKIINELNGNVNEMIFLYGRSYSFLNLLLIELERLNYKTKLVFDVVEPPREETSFFEYIKHPFIWESTLVFKRLLHRFDACTFITFKLYETFKNQANKKIIVPSVLYPFKKTIVKNYSNEVVNIGYLGSLLSKDFPELLYKFCLELYINKKPFKIIIIGRFRKFKEGRKWENVFLKSPFRESLEFYFNPNEYEKNRLLKSVDFLVLFRKPESLQSFTFPTRVVEMIGLGKLLILNNYGDIPLYFKNEENCIMIPEEMNQIDVNKIFNRSNKNYKTLVKNALILSEGVFSSSVQSRKILNLIS
jgi:hypothetical protein